jgi:putative endonuclease
MYYVYILKTSNKKYIGYSSNLKKRLKEHLEGKVSSTKYKKPIELIYYEAYLNKESAQKRERNLKKFGSAYSLLMKRLSS